MEDWKAERARLFDMALNLWAQSQAFSPRHEAVAAWMDEHGGPDSVSPTQAFAPLYWQLLEGRRTKDMCLVHGHVGLCEHAWLEVHGEEPRVLDSHWVYIIDIAALDAVPRAILLSPYSPLALVYRAAARTWSDGTVQEVVRAHG